MDTQSDIHIDPKTILFYNQLRIFSTFPGYFLKYKHQIISFSKFLYIYTVQVLNYSYNSITTAILTSSHCSFLHCKCLVFSSFIDHLYAWWIFIIISFQNTNITKTISQFMFPDINPGFSFKYIIMFVIYPLVSFCNFKYKLVDFSIYKAWKILWWSWNFVFSYPNFNYPLELLPTCKQS